MGDVVSWRASQSHVSEAAQYADWAPLQVEIDWPLIPIGR